MEEFKITETTNAKGVKIVVIGVGGGGGGGNMINELANSDISENIKLVAANTDAQALEHSSAPYKIQLGPETCRGLGAGADPKVGKAAAEESAEEIRKVFTEY